MSDNDRTGEPPEEDRAGGGELLIGLFFLALSGAVFVTSFGIPAPEGWQTAPGMLPMLIGGSLFIMSVVITLDVLKRGGWSSMLSFLRREGGPSEAPLWRTVTAGVGVAVFYFGLLRILPFEIAAFIFLAFMFQMFWKKSTLVQRLLVAVIMPFVITGSFKGAFGIPLPGDGSIVETVMYMLKG